MRLDDIEKRLDLAYDMRTEKLEPITPHLIGPTGVGKSTAVRSFAKKKSTQLHKQFLDYSNLTLEDIEHILKSPDEYFLFADKRLTELDPLDLSGLPRVIEDSQYVIFLPLALAKLLSKSAGLLFLDEFLNESRPNMLSSAYKIVLDHRIGDVALNKHVLVVAASNSAEHSSLSNSIAKPLRDRFDFIETEASTVESWVLWMDQQYGVEKWDRNILAYLLWKPSDFITKVDDTMEDNGFEPPATPRGWSYTALAFAKTSDPQLRTSIAKGKLGQVGATLIAFLDNKVLSFNELAANPSVINDYNIEQKYLTALTIAGAITHIEKNLPKVKKLLEYISEKADRELIAALFAFLQKPQRRDLYLSIKDNPTILSALQQTGQALL
jgi:hypothetical protein